MKNLLTTATALFFALSLFAQSQAIEFTYDVAGNRTQRHIITLEKNNNGDSLTNKSTEADAEVFTETIGEQQISIFPNPVKSRLNVQITNLVQGQTASLSVFTLSGEIMFKNENLKGSTKVDMSALPPGTYILKIRLGREVSTWKVIKK